MRVRQPHQKRRRDCRDGSSQQVACKELLAQQREEVEHQPVHNQRDQRKFHGVSLAKRQRRQPHEGRHNQAHDRAHRQRLLPVGAGLDVQRDDEPFAAAVGRLAVNGFRAEPRL
jgi:hypothetical protein